MINVKIDKEQIPVFEVEGTPTTVLCELTTIASNLYRDLLVDAIKALHTDLPMPKIIGAVREEFIKHFAIGMAVAEKDVIGKELLQNTLRNADNTPESKDTMELSEFMKSLFGDKEEPYKAQIKTKNAVQEENPESIVYTLKEFIDQYTDGNLDFTTGKGTVHDGETDTGVSVMDDDGKVKPLKRLGCQYVLWHRMEG